VHGIWLGTAAESGSSDWIFTLGAVLSFSLAIIFILYNPKLKVLAEHGNCLDEETLYNLVWRKQTQDTNE